MKNNFSHNTPPNIAKYLCESIPESSKKILEPSVGDGELLHSIIDKVEAYNNIVCVDISKESTEKVSSLVAKKKYKKIDVINAEYLQWSKENLKRYQNYFDCIIMNPPFTAKKEQWVNITLNGKARKTAIEVAFVLNSLSLLKPGGKLLAILPSSTISSSSFSWFRKKLLKAGIINYVHELPKFSFPGIESKIYLLDFVKCENNTASLILKNHSLDNPDVIKVKSDLVLKYGRMDFGFFESLKYFEDNLVNQPFNWVPLSELANLQRGKQESPKGIVDSIHTTEYKNGFWINSNKKRLIKKNNSDQISKGDLLIKRVGRNCSKSLGLHLNLDGYSCTDCVLIVRPKKEIEASSLLFNFRVIYNSYFGSNTLEKGTGAKYITSTGLEKVRIPVNLHKIYQIKYKEYLKALKERDFSLMNIIEDQMRLEINLNYSIPLN